MVESTKISPRLLTAYGSQPAASVGCSIGNTLEPPAVSHGPKAVPALVYECGLTDEEIRVVGHLQRPERFGPCTITPALVPADKER